MSSIRNISLYIPRVFANYSSEKISKIFESLRIGKVSNVKFINKSSNISTTYARNNYNSVCVYFDYWYNNVAAQNFQKKVLSPDETAMLVYDDPYRWIVLENKKENSEIKENNKLTKSENFDNQYLKFYIPPVYNGEKTSTCPTETTKRYQRKQKLALDMTSSIGCDTTDILYYLEQDEKQIEFKV